MRTSNQDDSHSAPSRLRCAIYTRKSTEEGLDQDFNSLDAQREAAQAFTRSFRYDANILAGWQPMCAAVLEYHAKL